jgi:hypothetical protein
VRDRSGGEGSREEGERAWSRARVRLGCGSEGADPDAEAQPAGRNRGEGIGRLEGGRKGRHRHVGPSWQREKEREKVRGAEGNGPGSAHVERGEKRRGPRERGVLGWAKDMGGSFFSLPSFLFLFYTQTSQTIPFEFK